MSLHKIVLLGCFFVLGVTSLRAADQQLDRATRLYQQTDYKGSLALLNKEAADGKVDFLISRDLFMLGDYKRSTEYLQKAITYEPSNSEYADWLGRIYGKRAELANPLSAAGLAVKARQAFERAIELDPKNSEALDDLFDFYLEAPGILGGGYDKAKDIAQKLAAVDPPEGHSAEARLAQKRKEFANAELQLRQAIAADPRSTGHRIALAKLLAREGRTEESDQIFLTAEKDSPNAAGVWFARADLLIHQNRDLDQAKELLRKYMQASLTVDDPPKEQALKLLKQAGGA